MCRQQRQAISGSYDYRSYPFTNHVPGHRVTRAAASPAASPAATSEEVRSGKIGDTLWNKEWRMTLDKIEKPGKTLT